MQLTACFVLLLQTFFCFAHPPSDYKFQRIGIAQGSSRSSGSTVMQARLGYIWAGTQGAMNRYVGNSDKEFEPIASDGLPEAPNANGDLFDYKQEQEIIEKNALKDAAGIKNELVAAVDLWLSGENNPDDSTIIVTKKK